MDEWPEDGAIEADLDLLLQQQAQTAAFEGLVAAIDQALDVGLTLHMLVRAIEVSRDRFEIRKRTRMRGVRTLRRVV